ncbi:MAG: bifunctional folylpolyglutamate synthase/dihydrofolate synthase [Thermoplasmata archaeon]|nr:bifunctional folylpolyglutamate synthase/dihydrofolate synthase [Thermoplasmata archaeon]
MTDKGAIEYLLGLEKFGMRLGLENVTELLDGMGNPHQEWKAVHVAGTNGKGSVCAYVSSILREAGYKVGLYTSPHLVRLNERIQVNGEQISDDRLEKIAEKTREVSERMASESPEKQITFFEFLTATAFTHFRDEGTDFGVLEVGLGGRLDATNVVTPEVCAIAHLAIEHSEHLGESLGQIAGEKAGIIKNGVPVVVSDNPAPQAIVDACEEKDASLIVVGKDIVYGRTDQKEDWQHIRLNDMHDIRIRLLGLHQIQNAATAFGVVESLRSKGHEIPAKAISDGFSKAQWPGRFQILKKDPIVVLDTAHNPDAATELRRSVDEILDYDKGILVLGMLEDKDIEGFAAEIYPVAGMVICTTPQNPRALPAEQVAEVMKTYVRKSGPIPNVADALQKALDISGEDDMILVTGSNTTVGEAMEYLDKVNK